MAAAILLVAVAVLYHDVLFLGRSVIPSNFHNPIDYRRTTENYGPEMVPLSEWSDRNLIASPNLRDPGATWWQWEPGIRFLERAVSDGEWPFWDPYLAAGTPAMANLLPAFFFPPLARRQVRCPPLDFTGHGFGREAHLPERPMRFDSRIDVKTA